MVLMTIAFFASHLALQWTVAVRVGTPFEAFAISIAYLALLLILSWASALLPISWRRTVISVAYGGVLGAFFTFAAIARSGIGGSTHLDPDLSAALLIALFLVWGTFTHAMIAVVFGSTARDDFWAHVRSTYSTFRKG